MAFLVLVCIGCHPLPERIVTPCYSNRQILGGFPVVICGRAVLLKKVIKLQQEVTSLCLLRSEFHM